jgi:hypothetical protein
MTNNEKYAEAIDNAGDYEAIVGDVKVMFEYIGEGYSGDYTGEEDDVPLWRFYTEQKAYMEEGHTGSDHPDWNWEGVDDASYCTTLPIDTPKEIMEKLVIILAERMEEVIREKGSVKRLGEECSWIDETWIKEKA